NNGLGIDLGPNNGVTANDANDTDAGPNDGQNFPVITSVVPAGGNTVISGTLNSTANRSFRIEFFSSPAADPSGNGEGRVFLGAITVSSATNNYTFAATIPGTIAGTDFVTATATDLTTLDTSEFSAAFNVP